MARALRWRKLTLLALCAALAAAVVMASGCGSPAAKQEGEEAAVQPTEAAEEEAAELGEAAEPAAEEGAPAEAPAEAAAPEAAETASGGGEVAAAAGAAVVASEALSAAEEAPPAEAAPEPAPAPPPDTDWTGTKQKWVPIFSLDREGARVGAAQVAGPTAQVDKVKGVAELRLRFKDIGRIYAYIPVSEISLTRQKRVQGVSVWAIGDIEILDL